MINIVNNVKASQHGVPTPHVLNILLLLLDRVKIQNINTLKKMFYILI